MSITITKLSAACAAAIVAAALAAPVTSASRVAVKKPDACWSAKAGDQAKSWCLSRTHARVERMPSAQGPRIRRAHVRLGSVHASKPGVSHDGDRITLTATLPTVDLRPQVEPPTVDLTTTSADAGAYDADTGMRDGGS